MCCLTQYRDIRTCEHVSAQKLEQPSARAESVLQFLAESVARGVEIVHGIVVRGLPVWNPQFTKCRLCFRAPPRRSGWSIVCGRPLLSAAPPVEVSLAPLRRGHAHRLSKAAAGNAEFRGVGLITAAFPK